MNRESHNHSCGGTWKQAHSAAAIPHRLDESSERNESENVVTCDSRAIRERSSDERSPNGLSGAVLDTLTDARVGERQGDPSLAPSLRGVMPRARCPKFRWRDAVLKPEIC
jgi:hypothetical protein